MIGLTALAVAVAASIGVADVTHDIRSTSPAPKVFYATVDRARDGDTLVVYDNDVRVIVRLLGVDTPETHDPRKPVQCYGPQSAAFTNTFTAGKRVRVTTEPSSGDVKDRYGRTLGYVGVSTTANGHVRYRDLGLILMQRGYARVYAFRGRKFGRITSYQRAEATAKRTHRGRWGACGA